MREIPFTLMTDTLSNQYYWFFMTGAVLTQEEIDKLIGKLERVTTTLQEKEKEKLKEKKVRTLVCAAYVTSTLFPVS